MTKYKNEETEFLNELVRIPRKNLETKIIFLEQEITIRKTNSDNALSELLTQQLQLKDRSNKPIYQFADIKEISNLKKQVWQLGVQILRELNSCFKDISELKEKLLESKEELEMSNLKSNLLNENRRIVQGR